MNYAVAHRPREYAFTNLTIPLPLNVRPTKESNNILIISHPGWHRLGLVPQGQVMLDFYMSIMHKNLGEHAKKVHGGPQNLIKDAYIPVCGKFGVRYVYDEIQVERAMMAANMEKTPVVITVPAHRLTANQFEARENVSRTFTPYLEHLHKKYGPIYALPTIGDTGYIRAQIDEQPGIAEESVETLVKQPWQCVYFAGGQIDACLSSTLSEFGRIPKAILIDDFCNPRKQDTTHSRKKKRVTRKLIVEYLKSGRSKVLHRLDTMLRPTNPIFHAKDEYDHALGTYHHAPGPEQKEAGVVRMNQAWWKQ